MLATKINQRISESGLFRSGIRDQKSKIVCILCFVSFMFLWPGHTWGIFHVVRSKVPVCSIIIPEKPSLQEKFALDELDYFVEKFTGQKLDKRLDSEPLPAGNVILIGTPDSNKYIGELADRGLILWKKNSSEEEFIVKVVNDDNQDFLVVGGQSRGVIYGVYTVVEKMIERIMEGVTPIDLDFNVGTSQSLAVGTLNIRSTSFYPIRCSLSQENYRWMSRHRVNVSGAEGVWTGTGIDDGLGTAFKYVQDQQFDDMQDETSAKRMDRIVELQARLMELKRAGIDSYLFMYVMGEPTKAMIKNHPELLEGTVPYPFSRDGFGYQPISWTKPEARELIKELVRSIVRTYSPWLTGFHLRAWGGETRAPAGSDPEQQELLWEIYFDIIEAAREVKPDFKVLISGYDQSWLKDPDRLHAAKLPQGTLFVQKWGIDGEPTSDPGIETSHINGLGEYGHRILVLSHDVEEVMPLWMLEADLFVEGVRKYADDPDVRGLGGFTIQGVNSFGHLDKIVSARAGWDPYEDYVALMENYLGSYYGTFAGRHILAALRINSLTLADYFSDYAGSLSLTGKYGNGSRGYATRFWDIIGAEAVEDTLSIQNLETVEYAKERLASLLPRQQEAANEMIAARERILPATTQAEGDYLDGMHLMKMWVRFFESRLRLVEARESGLRSHDREQIMQKLSSAIEYSREAQMEVAEIKTFTPIFNYDDELARESLVAAFDEEIAFLQNLDPTKILVTQEQNGTAGELDLALTEMISHPNPIVSDGATFCYNLASSADRVTITIYTIQGRRVRTITEASARAGYNEESWEAEDDKRRKLANGTYLYRMVAERDGKKVQRIDKLSIVR